MAQLFLSYHCLQHDNQQPRLSLCDRLILVSNEVIVYTNVSASDVLTDSKIGLIETCNLLDLEASRGSRALEESCLSRMHTPTYIY